MPIINQTQTASFQQPRPVMPIINETQTASFQQPRLVMPIINQTQTASYQGVGNEETADSVEEWEPTEYPPDLEVVEDGDDEEEDEDEDPDEAERAERNLNRMREKIAHMFGKRSFVLKAITMREKLSIRGPYHMVGKIMSLSPKAKRKMQEKRQKYEMVFIALSEKQLPRGYIAALSRSTGLKARTLSGWRSKVLEDVAWRPYTWHYGQHRRHFTAAEESHIMAKIKADWLDRGLFYSDQDFMHDMRDYYKEVKNIDAQMRRRREFCLRYPHLVRDGEAIPPAPRVRPETFSCSSGFVQRFRKRHQISLRRPTMKRRPKPCKEDMDRFKDRVREAEEKYGTDRMFNMDETNFHLVNMKHLTWAMTGADAVNCYNQNDVKSSVTVIATVSRSGEKLPLMLVAKGKDKRSLNKYGELVQNGTVWASLSESGWTRESVMIDYLERLRKHVGHDQPIVLLLDVYAAHRTKAVREKAEKLKINLMYIPPGCTDLCQPLDISVFAVLKGYARALWREYYHEHGEERMGWEVLMDHLAMAWNDIKRSTVLKGWEPYIFHGLDIGCFDDDDDLDGDQSGMFSVDTSLLDDSSSEWDL